uniref:Uncharacterized protein n=1 Tax=Klebsiella pneumoniae TaxID=573 RepID=A0A2S1JEW9_KLEPN|nr:hypothetical protein [Klebsiella pneumoniae]AYF52356.1 hypothetical protein [Klebsiella pneumoniae]
MTNQPATASQKTDEVTNKTTPSMTVDTIFSGALLQIVGGDKLIIPFC